MFLGQRQRPVPLLALAFYDDDLHDPADHPVFFQSFPEVQVTIEYLNGWIVNPKRLDVYPNATIEDFLNTPVSDYIGYITYFNTESMYFHLDRVEWLTTENDAGRLNQLGINPDDLPNGFYIYNPVTYPAYFAVN